MAPRSATIPRTKSLQRPALDERRTFSVAEAADIVVISRSTAYGCVRRGEIPSRRFGRRIVVLRHELERMLAAAGTPSVPMDVRQGR